MVNKMYLRGRSREYRIANKLRDEGLEVYRMAGSHSSFDLIALDKVTRIITFIQVKPKSMSNNAKNKIQLFNSWVEGDWRAKTCVVSLAEEIK